MPTQTQQTDPSVTNQNISYKPIKTAAIIGGKVLLSSDKTYPLTPASARHLAQQLQISADIAEYSGQSKEPANKFHHHSTYTQSANHWRQENGYIGKCGVVVFWHGKIQGWVNELREPQNWEPGCIAVDENGSEWITIGGNNYDGAKSWEKVSRSNPEKLPELNINSTGKQTLQDELKLISVCQEIGCIAGSNNQYTLSLTLHINKPVKSLTVAQLLSFHRECNQRFNNLEGLPVSDAGAIPKLILGRNTPFDKDTPITELDWYDENGNMTHKGVSHA